MDILILIALVLLSGMFSGLTIGLGSLSKQEIKRKADLGDVKASKVLSVLEDGNLLLVTLLLGNTLVNATLTNFMGSVVGDGIIAVGISTAVILIFGEITPAAVLTKYALEVGSRVTPLIYVLTKLFYVISKPIAMILDFLLGKEMDTFLNRRELSYIIDEHTNSAESDIDEQDGRLLKGVLSLSKKTAKDNMTPFADIFSFNYDQIINNEILDEIRKSGRTRIPIIKDKTMIGVLNSKNLIGLDEELEDKKTVSDIMKSNKMITSLSEDKIDDIIKIMIDKNIHISNVLEDNEFIGIITMEDIIEELFQTEIEDETD